MNRAPFQGLDAQGRWQDTQPEAGHAATEVGADQPADELAAPLWMWVVAAVGIVAACGFVAEVLGKALGITR